MICVFVPVATNYKQILHYSNSAKQMNTFNPDQPQQNRHPNAVRLNCRIASAAEDFVPPANLDVGSIQGLPWGQRMLHLLGPTRQYMVYDADRCNVLSCQGTPQRAAQMATDRLEWEARTPASFNPRLVGTQFAVLPCASSIMVHGVLDEDGAALGQAHTRQEAVDRALRMVLSRTDVLDLSFEEFSRVAMTAEVQRGRRQSDLPVIYADRSRDDAERYPIRSAIRMIWANDPTVREGLADIEEERNKFVMNTEVGLLRSAGPVLAKQNAIVMDLSFRGGNNRFVVVLHDGNVLPAQGLRVAYADYVIYAETQRAQRRHEDMRPRG